ncbi:MAG: nucleotidyltransferase domain-containing protein [Pseudomonadota bacterium]
MNNIINRLKIFFSDRKDVVALYLFGSHAKGLEHERSDVDIALLFERGKEPSLQEHLKLMSELSGLLRKEADVVILNSTDPVLKCQVFRYGTIVLERDRITSRRFVAKSIMEYIDLQYNRGIVERAMYKRLEKGASNG